MVSPPTLTDARARKGFKTFVVLSLILLSALAAYASTSHFDFAFDDHLEIVQNPNITSWSYLGSYFTTHAWSQNRIAIAAYYRPLLLVWLRIQYVLFGLNSGGWHVVSVALHLLVVLLLFLVTRQLTGNHLAAATAALVFAVHPVHVEPVSWICGSPDLLAACFLLGSLLLYLRQEKTQSIWDAAGALFLFVCASLSKETSIVFPAILLVYSVSQFLLAGKDSTDKKRFFRWLPVCIPVVIFYFVTRAWVLSKYQIQIRRHTWHGIYLVLLNQPKLIWFYFTHLIWPGKMSESYNFIIERRFSVQGVLLPALELCLVAAVLLALLYYIREDSPQFRISVAMSFAWLILPLLPILDLVFLPDGDYVHDRYLYLPSIGFCMLLGIIFSELAGRLRLRAPALACAGGAFLLFFSWLCFRESQVWRNDETLFRRALEVYPSNVMLRTNLGSYLVDQGRISEAISELNTALTFNPRYRTAFVNLAISYELLGNLKQAEQYWSQAEAIGPDPSIEANLARVRQQLAAPPIAPSK
jgi:protein O-mannosyl-transferase